ncbi:hypothetical protein [Mycoplasma sp. SG1]|uniref:hypothetical protein n=1 Tax=Mycoplasma sp. SG1 TaxID=2810348 RepID=UPI0020253D9C|nr:hypothetical protein [Mycoplasma sp. SG1]URM53158.1 hypothetical protein JRW51_02305 [Mycoplasma sp. SG1]
MEQLVQAIEIPQYSGNELMNAFNTFQTRKANILQIKSVLMMQIMNHYGRFNKLTDEDIAHVIAVFNVLWKEISNLKRKKR